MGCVLAAVLMFAAVGEPVQWRLAYTEDFKGAQLNSKLWRRIDRGHPDWCKNMSTRADLVTVSGGELHAHGIRNDDQSSDPRRVLTGGVSTLGSLAMQYGKVEIKCKLEGQKGAWPAMHVDWVKFYHGHSRGKRFSKFSRAQ